MPQNNFTLSVSQLNEYIHSLLGLDPLLKNLSIRGELSNFKRHSSGHLYFSLKDSTAVIRCVMFRQNAYTLRFAPYDGQQVILSGYVSMYERDGNVQFYCESMRPDGIGALYQQYERNKTRFLTEGLFDDAHKKPLPRAIHRIGVVTSETGAVIRDIIKVSHRRDPSVEILLCPCKVQGEDAADSIVRGIKRLNEADVDVLIVGRGGGSLEDLWAFNEEKVVRAVYASKKPVVSAVGHETDVTLCDFAADVRAATPSHAAELIVPDRSEARQELDELKMELKNAALSALDDRINELKTLSGRLSPVLLVKKMDERLKNIGNIRKNLTIKVLSSIRQRQDALNLIKGNLEAVNPEKVLKRGYAMVYAEKQLVTSITQAKIEENLSVRVSDGTIYTQILGAEKYGNEKTDL